MSLDSYLPRSVKFQMGGKEYEAQPLSVRQTARLAALADRLKGDIGFTREGLAASLLTPDGIASLVKSVFKSAVGGVDLDSPPDAPLTGNAKLICQELGALFGLTAEQMADVNIDDVYEAAKAMWEVNKTGPFATKLTTITETFLPMMTVAREAVAAGFQMEFMTALRRGGITDGGMIGSSSPLSGSLNGPNDTFWTNYPSEESLSLPLASDSTPPSETPHTPEPAGEAMEAVSPPEA